MVHGRQNGQTLVRPRPSPRRQHQDHDGRAARSRPRRVVKKTKDRSTDGTGWRDQRIWGSSLHITSFNDACTFDTSGQNVMYRHTRLRAGADLSGSWDSRRSSNTNIIHHVLPVMPVFQSCYSVSLHYDTLSSDMVARSDVGDEREEEQARMSNCNSAAPLRVRWLWLCRRCADMKPLWQGAWYPGTPFGWAFSPLLDGKACRCGGLRTYISLYMSYDAETKMGTVDFGHACVAFPWAIQ